MVARNGAGGIRVLSCTDKRPALLPSWMPVSMHAELENTPVFLVAEDLHGTRPEEWLDQNEERIVPRGFAADQVVNEWTVDRERVYSATVARHALSGYLEKCEQENIRLESLTPSLWDLAI
ncbi:MAG: hypothetical protein GF410_03070, partial [Chitinivibrionales bacterium]|nr:hypothetical protein [Chitinivibrionales bacterium]